MTLKVFAWLSIAYLVAAWSHGVAKAHSLDRVVVAVGETNEDDVVVFTSTIAAKRDDASVPWTPPVNMFVRALSELQSQAIVDKDETAVSKTPAMSLTSETFKFNRGLADECPTESARVDSCATSSCLTCFAAVLENVQTYSCYQVEQAICLGVSSCGCGSCSDEIVLLSNCLSSSCYITCSSSGSSTNMCPTEKATAQRCATDSCMTCLDNTVSTIPDSATCSAIEQTLCPAITQTCSCGSCADEIETWFSCVADEISCTSFDCSDSTSSGSRTASGDSSSGPSGGVIAGAVIGALVLLALVAALGVIQYRKSRGGNSGSKPPISSPSIMNSFDPTLETPTKVDGDTSYDDEADIEIQPSTHEAEWVTPKYTLPNNSQNQIRGATTNATKVPGKVIPDPSSDLDVSTLSGETGGPSTMALDPSGSPRGGSIDP